MTGEKPLYTTGWLFIFLEENPEPAPVKFSAERI
jgi:hypothetical protein